MPGDVRTASVKAQAVKAYAPKPTPMKNLGGKFTPGGFVPNKPKITAPPDQAPFRHGHSPAQKAVGSLGASGDVTVKTQAQTNTDAQRYAQTKAMQRQLVAHGYKIAVDGILGPQTQAAYTDYFGKVAATGVQGSHLDASKQVGFATAPTPQSVAAQNAANQTPQGKTNLYLSLLYHQGVRTQNFNAARQIHDDVKRGLIDARTGMMALAALPKGTKGYLARIPGEISDFTWGQAKQIGQLGNMAAVDLGRMLPNSGAAQVAPDPHLGDALTSMATGMATFPYEMAKHPLRNPVGTLFAAASVIDPLMRLRAGVAVAHTALGVRLDERAMAQGYKDALASPINSPVKAEIRAEALKSGMDPAHVDDALALYDAMAYAEARRLGVTPADMLARVWAGASYAEEHPELNGHIPEEVYAQMDEVHNINPDKQGRNLRAKINPRNAQKGLPTYDVVSPKTGIRILGKPTLQEWLTRINYSTPDLAQQGIDAKFYDRLEPIFQKVFGDGYMPVLKAFSASQVNAGTADGLSSVLKAAERIERGAPVVNEEGGIASVVADQIEGALKGNVLQKGQAAKLSDFIDSIRGLKTREWMAHDPRGLAPAAGDIWSSRDMGFHDRKNVHAEKGSKSPKRHALMVDEHGVDLRQLEPDIPGAPSGARYERINEFYNEMAHGLNEIKYHGREDWTPAQAQAMGWAAIQRFYGGHVEDVMSWVDSGIAKAKRKIRFDQHAEAQRHIASPNGVHILDRKTAMEAQPHPDYLYHGTDDHGLQGIMNEGKIRATATERAPDDIRAWLTDHPSRAGAQGKHVIAIPRKNIPAETLSDHPLGMHSSESDIPIFGSATDSRVVQVHSEADPYPDLHPQEHAGYQALDPAQKAQFANAVDRAVEGSTFKGVLGLEDKGHHLGVGVWDGQENPGLGSHAGAPARLTKAIKAKYNALAAAQGMAKEQGSVSWGRPLPADATGADIYPALLSRQPASGELGAHVDALAGHGMVGVIHGPENSTYLVDFTGGKVDLASLDPAGTPVKWQGGYVHDERLTGMASDGTPTFQEAISAVPEASTLKNAVEHTNAVVKHIQDHFFQMPGAQHRALWDGMLEAATKQMGEAVGPRGLTAVQREHAENYLIKHLPEEYSNQFYDLMEAAGQARNAPDPEFLFGDNPTLFGSMERAQGHTQLLRQDAKGAVKRFSDLRHELLITPKTDLSTLVHEMVHAMIPYLGHMGTDEEALARSFEAYVREGHAPNKALQPLFDTLSKGMHEVYGEHAVPGSALSPELRQHFNDFFNRTAPDRRLEDQRIIPDRRSADREDERARRVLDTVSPTTGRTVREMTDSIGRGTHDGVYRQEDVPAPEGDGAYGLTKAQLDEAAQKFIKKGRVGRKAQDISDSNERALRGARADAALMDKSEPDGRQRQINALEELKGFLPKVEWEGHEELNSATVTAMIDHIQFSTNLGVYTKTRAVATIERLLTDRPPTESEFKTLEKIFGKQPGLRMLKDDTPAWKHLVYEVLNVPRSIMASFDLSAPLRQGLILGSQHPLIATRAGIDMFKMFASEKFYNSFMRGVQERPNALNGKYEVADLATTDMEHADGTEHGEEAYASGLAERLVTFNLRRFGRDAAKTASPIRWSGRAYTGFLVKLRTDVFDHLIAEAEKARPGISDDPKFLKDLGNFINAATGRGQVLKNVEGSLDLLNTVFFSPRLMASRMNFLNFVNPENYYNLDPFVRRQKILAVASTAGTIVAVLGLASLIPGVSVGLDPRSADFGKIKVGDTRMDVAGGFQQYIRLFSEIGTMSTVSSTTGATSSLWSSKFGAKTGLDVALGFLEGKAAPITGIGIDALRGKDAVGNPITPWSEFKSHMIPLIGQDVVDIIKDPPVHGVNPILAAFLGYSAETFGTGLQTYKPKVPGAAHVKKYDDLAKKLGMTIPAPILANMTHAAALRSISSAQTDKTKRLAAYIDYFAKETGNHSLDSWKGNMGAADKVENIIRATLTPGASRYQKVIDTAAKAKGLE